VKFLVPSALVCAAFLFVGWFSGCAGEGPDYSQYEWRKPGGTAAERDRLLAEGNVHAIQAYPDPISQAQIDSEPINAPAIRAAKRNEVIISFMASKGWHLVPKTEGAARHQ
jgi:hypothetical protein